MADLAFSIPRGQWAAVSDGSTLGSIYLIRADGLVYFTIQSSMPNGNETQVPISNAIGTGSDNPQIVKIPAGETLYAYAPSGSATLTFSPGE